MIWIVVAAVAICGTASIFLQWAVPKKYVLLGLVLFCALVGTFLLDLLGRPKPMHLSQVQEVQIVSTELDYDRAIHIWARDKGELRYYILPWNTALAKRMQELEEGRQLKTVGKITLKRRSGEWELDGERLMQLPKKGS